MFKGQIETDHPVQLQYRLERNKKDMRHQFISYLLMVFLTLVAFLAVGFGNFSIKFVIPFILILAAVQVGFQLYYFMHMSNKGHEVPALFIYSAVLVAVVMIIAFITIIWI